MESINLNSEAPAPARKRRWPRVVLVIFLVLAGVAAAAVAYLRSEAFKNSLRERIVLGLQQRLGTQVELGGFDFSWSSLTVHLTELRIQGKARAPEAATAPTLPVPFFSARSLDASWRLLSLLPLKTDFDSVQVVAPKIHVEFHADGSSNIPTLQTAVDGGGMWAEQLIGLRIGSLQVVEGEVRWDERRVPLEFQTEDVELTMKFVPAASAPAERPDEGGKYAGALSLRNAQFQFGQGAALAMSAALKFDLFPQRVELNEVKVQTAKSTAEGTVRVNDLRRLDLSLEYAVHLDWQEAAAWLKAGNWRGDIDWRGQGRITAASTRLGGQLTVNTLQTGLTNWEHVPWRLRSSLTVVRENGETAGVQQPLLANLQGMRVDAVGGIVTGSTAIKVHRGTTSVTSDLQLQRAKFAAAAHALRALPVDLQRLPWAAELSGPVQVFFEQNRAGITRSQAAQQGRPAGQPRDRELMIKLDLVAEAPEENPAMLTPVAGKFKATILPLDKRLEEVDATIDLPGTRMLASGWMQENDSEMRLRMETTNLASVKPAAELFWRGVSELPIQLNGEIKAQSEWSGGWRDARFRGPVTISSFSYGQHQWDYFSGDLNFHRRVLDPLPDASAGFPPTVARRSRAELEVTSGRIRQGRASAEVALEMSFENGLFLPESAFRVSGKVHQLEMRAIQSVAGTSLPVQGEVDASFSASGTRQNPRGRSTISMVNGSIQDQPFAQLSAEIQFEPGPVINISPLKIVQGGVLTGRATVRPSQRQFEFDLTAANFQLSELRILSGSQTPLNGLLDGHVTGGGSYDAPVIRGTFNLQHAGVGVARDGQLRGEVQSDRRQLQWTANGTLLGGEVSGTGRVGLQAPHPLTLSVTMQNAGLSTLRSFAQSIPEGLDGALDGKVQISGNAGDARTIVADGQLDRVEISRMGVSMRNREPVVFHYDNQQVRVDELHLVGEQVDLRVGGTIRTTADPAMNLRAVGTIDLASLSKLDPQVATQGQAELNAQISGTLRRPQWRGRLTVRNASAQFGRLANSLSAIRGAIVFDGNRGDLEGFRAESGGGEVLIGGALRYGEGSGLQFSLNGTVHNVRVRYPEALSTWVDGQLTWTGSTRASLLEGRVTINRHFIAPPNDLAQVLLGRRRTSSPATGSPFLRNLRLNLNVSSAPEVRIDTRTARNLQTDVEARLQGTAEQPVILGRVGVLSGQIEFAGKRYTINRGEITFINPFRFEPVLNLNVQARVQQYDITMDFSGPPDRLNVTYRSDPPLPTRDILALLVAGGARQTSIQPSAQPLPQVTADSLLSQALSSQIGSRLDRIFGAGRVRVDPQLNTLGGTASATIALEQQIGNNITLLYATDVSSAQQQYVQGEWIISPKLSVVGIRDQNGLVGVNFQITLRFQ